MAASCSPRSLSNIVISTPDSASRESNGILIQPFAQIAAHIPGHILLPGNDKAALEIRSRLINLFGLRLIFLVFHSDFHDNSSPASALQPNVEATSPLESHFIGVYAGHNKLT